jgi:hypothetical protein
MTRHNYFQRLLALRAATVVISPALFAQTTPQYELFAGGSFERVHPGGSELTQKLGLSSFLYPATELVSPSPNFNKTVPVITHEETVLFGPRFSLRKRGRVFLFVHCPVGIAHINTSLSEQAVIASNFKDLPVGTLKSNTGSAISPGVGVEVRVNRVMMIRPFQLDYQAWTGNVTVTATSGVLQHVVTVPVTIS